MMTFCLTPSLARADTVITLGPTLSTGGGVSESCPSAMLSGNPGAAEPDCAYVNSTEPSGVIAQAPADGEITTWRVAGFQGTARLLVLDATGGGGYEIVQKSAAETEPCVITDSFCGPSLSPYVFTTNLPIQKGEYIGIEGISPDDCNGTPDQPEACTFIGVGPGSSTSEYWDTAPAVGAPATPSGSDTGRLVNADEDIGPKVVSVSLAPTTITADGLATTTATAAVTQNGDPVAGDSVTITSSDSDEKISAVTDNGHGTYTATITSSETVGTPTITATDVSDTSQPSGTATLTQAAPNIKVAVKPSSITADGKSTATATVTLTGVEGEPVPGQSVTITATGPAFAGPVTDNGDGSYTASITASHAAGTATVTAVDTSVDPNVSGHAQLTLKALPKTKKPTKPKKPKTCTVPKLAGDTLAAAKRALGRTKCKVGTVSTKKSGTVGKGHVISSSPTAGSRHKAGTRVNLAVSGGKQ
jgi:hypothetical protein